MNFIRDNEMYSLLFLRRRTDNTRGSPVKAALLWSMLEEARISVENHFNLNMRATPRPLREAVNTITGESFLRTNLFNNKLFRSVRYN